MTKRKKEGEVGAGACLKAQSRVQENPRACPLFWTSLRLENSAERQYKYNTAAIQTEPQLSYNSPLWNDDHATNVMFDCPACFSCLALMNEDAAQSMGLRSQRDTQWGGVTGPGITKIKSGCRENFGGPLGLVLCVGGPGTQCPRVSHPATM